AEPPKPPKVTLFPIAPRVPPPAREPAAPPPPPVRQPVAPPTPPIPQSAPTAYEDFAAELAGQVSLDAVEEVSAAPEPPLAAEPVVAERVVARANPMAPAAAEIAFGVHAIEEPPAIDLSPVDEPRARHAPPPEPLVVTRQPITRAAFVPPPPPDREPEPEP